MVWIFMFALIVANMWLTWRVDSLKSSVAEMWEAVHFYAMTGGTGKFKKACIYTSGKKSNGFERYKPFF